jgi:hypothetical protein
MQGAMHEMSCYSYNYADYRHVQVYDDASYSHSIQFYYSGRTNALDQSLPVKCAAATSGQVKPSHTCIE